MTVRGATFSRKCSSWGYWSASLPNLLVVVVATAGLKPLARVADVDHELVVEVEAGIDERLQPGVVEREAVLAAEARGNPEFHAAGAALAKGLEVIQPALAKVVGVGHLAPAGDGDEVEAVTVLVLELVDLVERRHGDDLVDVVEIGGFEEEGGGLAGVDVGVDVDDAAVDFAGGHVAVVDAEPVGGAAVVVRGGVGVVVGGLRHGIPR
jgi:hypothetical protein